ncbi:alpha-L-fucosidase [Runella sp. MFBS21]|uniref:alpha-L-fucosidase n=1 Tax=Runella sp. MFBS21 TaxID=3034018 RepID=UPI0023F9391C|nr:alpha-L-fucosidase [Runella sp. MFBS21]MDF7817481.1 alpha-L-fucosidase [Runella sp. MFBS21]
MIHSFSKFHPSKLLFLLSLLLCCKTSIGQKTASPVPYGVTPSERLLAWHELEFYGFIHFTINTFTDKEWGYGDESPTLFNPTHFDADQIVLSMKAAGMKAIILTAKHHDGFCLWPTKTTEHNITKSPWKNGKGDVVREISDACRRHGLKFGVYLSPWDRNNEHYATPHYVNTIFQNQLRELLTNYGPVFEVWFDGANGGDGYYGGKREERKIDRITYYNLDELWNVIRPLQPMACIFSDLGPEIRWVGNESGVAGETCWPTYTPKGREDINKPGLGQTRYEEGQFGTRDGKYWIPAECDVSIRPGWFYHESENNRVRSVENLVNLYFKSVGHGASMLLNIPPSRKGTVYPTDSITLAQMGNYLQRLYAVNYATTAKVKASAVRSSDKAFAPENVRDADRYSYWGTPDGVTTGEITLQFSKPTTFDVVRLRENIKLGVRSDDWEVWAQVKGQWQLFGKGTAIGASRLVKGPKVTAEAIKVSITKGKASICISDIGVFNSPELPKENLPVISRDEKGQVHIVGESKNASIVYEKNRNAISATSTPYQAPFLMSESGSVSAAFLNKDGSTSRISTVTFGILPQNWTLYKNQATQTTTDNKQLALDNNPKTVWLVDITSQGTDALILDTQKNQLVKGISYVPDPANGQGNITHYALYGSQNGNDWQLIQEGEFSNIEANPRPQRINIPKDKGQLRYLKLVPKRWVGTGHQVRIADLLLL